MPENKEIPIFGLQIFIEQYGESGPFWVPGKF